MVKLKKPFYLLITIFVIVVAVIVGMIAYLLSSGVMVKYDADQKRYLIDASGNKYLEGLALKYLGNLVSTNENTSITEKTKEIKSFGELVGIKNQNIQNQQNKTVFYPYFPSGTETFIDEEHKFQIKAFQPVYKEFLNFTHNKYFLVINYSDSANGTLKEAKIFLDKQILYKEADTDQGKLIDSITLKELLNTGDQFGIYYLSTFPDNFSLDLPYCNTKSVEGPKTECWLANVKQANEKNWGETYFPLFVYRNLKL